MFDNVGKGQRQDARRTAGSLLLSLLLNGTIGLALVWISAKAIAKVEEPPPPMVPVDMSLPPPPPPPPPAGGGKKKEKKIEEEKPEEVVPVVPEILPEETPPEVVDDSEDEGEEAGVEGGEKDGVADGVVGGQKDGVVGGTGPIGQAVKTVHWSEIQVKTRVLPVFPEAAKALGLSNENCVVHIVVGTGGRAEDISFKACPELFKNNAREAATKWEWYPLAEAGQPIKAQFDINFNFRLK